MRFIPGALPQAGVDLAPLAPLVVVLGVPRRLELKQRRCLVALALPKGLLDSARSAANGHVEVAGAQRADIVAG